MLPEARSTAWTSRGLLAPNILGCDDGFPLGLGKLYRAYFRLEDPALMTSAHTSGGFAPPLAQRTCRSLAHGNDLLCPMPSKTLRQFNMASNNHERLRNMIHFLENNVILLDHQATSKASRCFCYVLQRCPNHQADLWSSCDVCLCRTLHFIDFVFMSELFNKKMILCVSIVHFQLCLLFRQWLGAWHCVRWAARWWGLAKCSCGTLLPHVMRDQTLAATSGEHLAPGFNGPHWQAFTVTTQRTHRTVAPCACCVNLYVCMYKVSILGVLEYFLPLYHFFSIFLSFLSLISRKRM